MDPPPSVNQSQTRKLREAPPLFGQSPFKAIVFGPPPPDNSDDSVGSKKRKLAHDHENDITRFKRVRILSKRTCVRKTRPGPEPFVRFASENKGFSGVARNQVYRWTESKVDILSPDQTDSRAPQPKTPVPVLDMPPLPDIFQRALFPLTLGDLRAELFGVNNLMTKSMID